MSWVQRLVCAVVLTAAVASPAGATTLIRAGLEGLVAGHETIVVGEVLGAYSYWNADGSFILTDVSILASDVLKGEAGERILTVTLMGGSVGDTTTLIIGGAELFPGRSYVLFLDREELPGAPAALTVAEHVQGAFELVLDGAGDVRAVSQASRHPLAPDAFGQFEAPGGSEGMRYSELVESIRDLAGRRAERVEVK